MTLIVDQVKDNISEATEFRTEIAHYDNFLQTLQSNTTKTIL